MKQLISILLSSLILLSSTGVTYAQHFCGEYEMMAKITLGQESLSCGMVMPQDDGCSDESSKDHNCCDNEYTQVDTDDNFSGVSFDFQLQPEILAAFVSVFMLQEIEVDRDQLNYYKDYSPPPLENNLQVLYETFLI